MVLFLGKERTDRENTLGRLGNEDRAVRQALRHVAHRDGSLAWLRRGGGFDRVTHQQDACSNGCHGGAPPAEEQRDDDPQKERTPGDRPQRQIGLGNAIARGGMVGGVGGQIEISGKETLVYRGTVETARDGQRGGTLLLDPKNIIIADGVNAPSQYGLVLQAFASNFPTSPPAQPGLEAGDRFGYSVSLSGQALAVGVSSDDGDANGSTDAGAAYLFTFADASFGGAQLQAVLGADGA